LPELPEAEVARATLAPHVVGRRIEEVVLRMPTRVRRPFKLPKEEDQRAVAGFVAGLQGGVITGIERRGKGLVFALDDGHALEFNFGLWASVTVRDRRPEVGTPLDPPVKRLGLALGLSGATETEKAAQGPALPKPWLVFADIAFSTYGLASDEPAPGPPPYDALDPALGPAQLAELAGAASRRSGELKSFLMDERLLLGIGNGYADEILWHARLHPWRSVTTMGAEEWGTLLAALRDVLREAIAQGGEPGFLDGECRPGRYERRIHHHAGDACPRCGAALVGHERSGRETNLCVVCQPEP
jgi:formamidopyrimidine-DNA glycosylase